MNGITFLNILRVIHNMEFEEFCGIFNYPTDSTNDNMFKYSYALEKYQVMKKSLITFVGHLDSDNLEIFFDHLKLQAKQKGVPYG